MPLRHVLVVGGTEAATRHLLTLLSARVQVTAVARQPSLLLCEICRQHGLHLARRPLIETDLAGVDAVCIATRDEAEDTRVAAAAWACAVPAWVEGRPRLSTLDRLQDVFSLPLRSSGTLPCQAGVTALRQMIAAHRHKQHEIDVLK